MTTPDLDRLAGLPGGGRADRGGGVRPRRRHDRTPRQRVLSRPDGGAPAAPPAVPASPPAPWTAPAPTSTSVAAAAVPIQPPFGAIDVPMSGAPSSVPTRSFGGASAGSASPSALAPVARDHARGRAVLDRRPASIRSSRPSGVAAAVDSPEAYVRRRARARRRQPRSLRSPRRSISARRIGALVAATGFSAAPGFAAPGYGASGVPAPGLGDALLAASSAVAPPPSGLAASGLSTAAPLSPEPFAPAAAPNAMRAPGASMRPVTTRRPPTPRPSGRALISTRSRAA